MKTMLQEQANNPKNKVLFPRSGITKNDVIRYYEKIADHILPYLKHRPLTMQRFPKGILEEGFFQKHIPSYFPDWIPTVKIRKVGGWVNHVVCNTKETLLYLVSQDVLTFHVALSKIDKIDYPDKLIFDLDPPKGNFDLVIKAAKALRDLLEESLTLKTFIMTTGSRGLHVVIPLSQKENFIEAHDFAKIIANHISNANPKEFTTALRKDKRKGRLYIDYLRNSYSQTSVSPFSLRALENAPVATLLSWDELDDITLNAQSYTIDTIFNRLGAKRDPWEGFEAHAGSIHIAKKKLEALVL